jgi:excisionase family DNA binding protein
MVLSSGSLSLQEAADELGVHYMTIYRYVRLGQLEATKVGAAWQVERAELERFRRGGESHHVRGEAPWAERLEARMIAGDAAGAWSVVEAALAAGRSPSNIYTDVLSPALVSIGQRWSAGTIGIEDEHMATAIASRIIGRLGPRFTRRGRHRGTIVTAMPSGERHGLGIAMVADILRGEGFAVLDLGPDTPTETLIAAIDKAAPIHAVCLSASHDPSVSVLAEMVSAVHSRYQGSIPVIVGGRAVADEEVAGTTGADAWASNPRDITGLLDHLAGQSHTA